MPITMHKFGELKKNIGGLVASYSTLLGRYTIGDSTKAGSVSEEPIDALRTLIGRTNDNVVQCETDRISARESINELIKELRPLLIDEASVEDKKKGTWFLLGGLIHRYYRIDEKYKNPSPWLPSSSWLPSKMRSAPTNCRLRQAIGEALKIEERNLDDLTIYTALKVFYDNMMLKKTSKGNDPKSGNEVIRYKTYPHLKDDKNFETNLKTMIAEYAEKTTKIRKDFTAIAFMKSLMIHLNQEIEPVEKTLLEWCTAFSKKQKDWSNLNQTKILAHAAEFFKTNEHHVIQLIGACFKGNRFEKVKDSAMFFEVLQMANSESARLIICGGFLLLKNFANVSEQLTTHVADEMALGKSLTKEDIVLCIGEFQDFLIDDVNENLDCDVFGGRAQLLSEAKKYLHSAKSKQAEPELEPEPEEDASCSMTL